MDKFYTHYITHQDRIFVERRTERGQVISFVVKLLCDIEGMTYEVVRYDSGHGCPHKDILDTAGHVISERKLWYDYSNNNVTLTMAVKDMKEHCEFYRERFIKWLKSDQQ
jgi:hypothetical protein